MDPCSCGSCESQRWRHSRMTIQDWKRTQAGPTGAQPPHAGTVSAFGRMPMRNRNRIVATLCARRPGGADRATPGDQIGKGVRFVRGLASGAQRSEPWSLPVILLIMIIRRVVGTLQIKPSGPISSKKALLIACKQVLSGILRQPERLMSVC